MAPMGGMEGGSSGDSLYDQAVAVVLRDKKVSTSYVQRRLQIGYNKAASLIERMEKEGLISCANAHWESVKFWSPETVQEFVCDRAIMLTDCFPIAAPRWREG